MYLRFKLQIVPGSYAEWTYSICGPNIDWFSLRCVRTLHKLKYRRFRAAGNTTPNSSAVQWMFLTTFTKNIKIILETANLDTNIIFCNLTLKCIIKSQLQLTKCFYHYFKSILSSIPERENNDTMSLAVNWKWNYLRYYNY